MSRLEDLVHRNQKEKQKEEGQKVDILCRIHHGLMCKYGWINYEEFMSLPIPTVYGLLLECINEAEEMNKSMDDTRSGLKGGRGAKMAPLPSRPR